MLDEENPNEIIERYRDPASMMSIALSKWYLAASNIIEPETPYEMRKCEVIRYLDKDELYEVRWLCNGSYKKVSRFNLVFVMEDQEAFMRRMTEAERLRSEAELMMRYYLMIEKTSTPKYDIKDNQKTRISYMILSYRPYVSDRTFRNPLIYLELPPGERYLIPASLTEPRINNLYD